jgi:CBS domain-containing protein
MEISDDIDAILNRKGRMVLSIGPDATVFDAIRSMSEKNVGALLVMESGSLAGIISERDYTRKVILMDRSSKVTKVRDIMTHSVVTTRIRTSIAEAMRLMTRHRVRHLPVMDGTRVIGVVSMGDLVERTIASQRSALEQLEGYIVGRYPG